jgi:hypothetical protein
MNRTLLSALAMIAGLGILNANAISVTTNADSGAGSLRQAITDANNNAGADTITFNIPGAGVNTITPVTPLPIIIGQVVIDGSTQPGFAGLPLIEISAAILGNNGNAFVIQSGGEGSTIRALVINHGWSAAILLQASNVIVEGCFLGTDSTGTSASANGQGVNCDFGFNVSGTRIGGTTAAARNLISGNATGIVILSGTGNVVEGNFIGTDVTGGNAITQTGTAIDVRSNNNVIGGTSVAARNIIAGSGGFNGVDVRSGDGNLVQGNFIGLDVTGTKALAPANAVFLSGGTNTLIGGLTATPGTPPGNVPRARVPVFSSSNKSVLPPFKAISSGLMPPARQRSQVLTELISRDRRTLSAELPQRRAM